MAGRTIWASTRSKENFSFLSSRSSQTADTARSETKSSKFRLLCLPTFQPKKGLRREGRSRCEIGGPRVDREETLLSFPLLRQSIQKMYYSTQKLIQTPDSTADPEACIPIHTNCPRTSPKQDHPARSEFPCSHLPRPTGYPATTLRSVSR